MGTILDAHQSFIYATTNAQKAPDSLVITAWQFKVLQTHVTEAQAEILHMLLYVPCALPLTQPDAIITSLYLKSQSALNIAAGKT